MLVELKRFLKENVRFMTCKKCGKKRKLLKTGYCELCNEEFCDELAGRI